MNSLKFERIYDPLYEVLTREINDEVLRELLSDLSSVIEAYVDFGTHIFQWDVVSGKVGESNLVVLSMFRYILEQLDALSILIKQSCIEPSKSILRSLLEYHINLYYLLENNTEERATAYIVCELHRKIKYTEKYYENTTSSQNLRALLKKDASLKNYDFPVTENGNSMAAHYMNLLNNPNYARAEAEYHRLKKENRNKDVPWYNLFSELKNIQAVAHYLGLHGFYEIFYRDLSNPTHGTDILDYIIQNNKKGEAIFIQMRHCDEVQHIVQQILVITNSIFRRYVINRVPEHAADFDKWHEAIKRPTDRIFSNAPLISYE